MVLSTFGKTYSPGFELKIHVSNLSLENENLNTKDRFKIILIEEGTGIFTLNNERLILNSSTIICLNERDNFFIEKQKDLKMYTIYFNPTVINSAFTFEYIHNEQREDFRDSHVQDLYWLNCFIVRDDNYRGYMNLNPVVFKKMVRLTDRLYKHLNDQPDHFWMCRSRSYFLEVLILMSQVNLNDELNQNMIIKSIDYEIEDIILYIHTHYDNKITIEKLEDTFNINRTTLNEMFKKALGETVIAYVIKLRLHIASIMLKDTNIPINEIAYRVGFQDIINFGRSFKKRIGCTPKEYRQLYPCCFE